MSGTIVLFHKSKSIKIKDFFNNENVSKVVDFERKTDLVVFLHIPKTGGFLYFFYSRF